MGRLFFLCVARCLREYAVRQTGVAAWHTLCQMPRKLHHMRLAMILHQTRRTIQAVAIGIAVAAAPVALLAQDTTAAGAGTTTGTTGAGTTTGTGTTAGAPVGTATGTNGTGTTGAPMTNTAAPTYAG